MDIVTTILLVIAGLLALLSLFLLWYCLKLQRVVKVFFEKGNIQDSRELLFGQVQKSKDLQAQLNQAVDRIANLESIAKISFQKMGVIRFNPFADMGGNQSFVIALLDSSNNGVVVSSLFTKEGNRVYAKQVVAGKSEHILSNEEREAIERAMKISN